VPEVADSCGLSYTGLEQHLLFYHKDLVKRRIRIRKKALRRQRKGEITGRGTVHAPSPELVEKYAEAVPSVCHDTHVGRTDSREDGSVEEGILRAPAKVASGPGMQAEEYPLRGRAASGLV